jgi:hypothetical protein
VCQPLRCSCLSRCAAIQEATEHVLRDQGLHAKLEAVLEPDDFAAWNAKIEDTWLSKASLRPLIITALIQEVREVLEGCQEGDTRDDALKLVDDWEGLHERAVVSSHLHV